MSEPGGAATLQVPTPGPPTRGQLHIDAARVTRDGLLQVEGWAVGAAPVERLQVFLGHQFVGLAELGLPRHDVGLALPQRPHAAWSGFRLVADICGADLSGRAVHVRALLAGGGDLRASTAPQVTVIGHPPAPPAAGIEAQCEHCACLPDGGWAVSGWAVSRDGIAAVALALDDGPESLAETRLSRPDIGNRFPRIPAARHAGFAFRGRLEGAAPRLLHVRIRAADGQAHALQHRLAGPDAAAEAVGTGQDGVGRDLANRIKFFVDSPELADGVARRPVRSALSVQGWAIARDGIDGVRVAFDDIDLGAAAYGLHRPDIGVAFADWPNARRSGFALSVAPRLLTAGPHRVRVLIRDKAGGETATAFGVQVAAADAAPIASTLLRRRMHQAELDLDAAIVAAAGRAPRFAVVLALPGLGEAERRRARATLQSLHDQLWEGWQALLLLPPGAPRPKGVPDGVPEDATDDATAGAALLAGWDASRVTLRAAREGRRAFAGRPEPTHVLRLRPGDRLGCDALMEFALAASLHPAADFLYADERRFDPVQNAVAADFRPDWSPDLLLSSNYLGRTWCAARGLAARLGGKELSEAAWWGMGDYALVLRLTERAGAIHHVPKVLCQTVRLGDTAAQERAALQQALTRRGVAGRVAPGPVPGVHRVRRGLGAMAAAPAAAPLVSVIMPTCAGRGLFRTAIAGLREATAYAAIELVAVDNIPADQPEDSAWLAAHADTVVRLPGAFNWSRFNNAGARAARGDILLFLNDDVQMNDPGWLAAMLEQVRRPEIGVVGARLLYPDGTLQHAGITLSPTGGLHRDRFMPGDYPGAFGRLRALREVSAVTGACLMVRRAVFDDLDGFDEAHAIINNDLDFCLRARARGLSVVCAPDAELVHHELASRAGLGEVYDAARLRAVCGPALARGDPYHNPNLSRFSETAMAESEPTRLLVAGHPLLAASRVRRILALKLDHIGDFVTAFPALRRLKQRFPAARLDVLCSPASTRLARLEPAIDAVLEFSLFHEKSGRGRRRIGAGERAALAERLGDARYDLAIDLRKHPETRPLLQATGATLLAGFDRDRAFPWLDVAPEWDGDPRMVAKRRHVADDLLALVEAVAVACEPARHAPLALDGGGAALDGAGPILPPRGAGRLRICVHPGAGTAMRQWPPEYFATLMDLLAEDEDAEFVMIGSGHERGIVARVMRRVAQPERVHSLVGRLRLEELPGVLRQCDLFIGNNSGPQHLAGALGIPTVGIHSGVVDPHEWGPFGPRAVAVYREMACSPCYLTRPRACPRGLACLHGLLPADVAAACRKLAPLRLAPAQPGQATADASAG